MTIMSGSPSSAAAASSTLTSNGGGTSSPTKTTVISVSSAAISSQITSSLNPPTVIFVTSVDGDRSIITSTATVSTFISTSAPTAQAVNRTPIIAGTVSAAVAVVLGATIIYFLLRWRRQRRNPTRTQPFRQFSYKSNLEPMYRHSQSIKCIFKTNTLSELAGSTPNLSSPESVSAQNWEKRYENPSDFGKLQLPRPSAEQAKRASHFSEDRSSQDGHAQPRIVYELPTRSNSREAER